MSIVRALIIDLGTEDGVARRKAADKLDEWLETDLPVVDSAGDAPGLRTPRSAQEQNEQAMAMFG